MPSSVWVNPSTHGAKDAAGDGDQRRAAGKDRGQETGTRRIVLELPLASSQRRQGGAAAEVKKAGEEAGRRM
ncbi:unnamed protein product [Linum trigynum]|uniref:Uncharacterized protein n=1 Tax=Linum trigynum TaxID=586398 RepID=A0AAV2GKI8_9ROSI